MGLGNGGSENLEYDENFKEEEFINLVDDIGGIESLFIDYEYQSLDDALGDLYSTDVEECIWVDELYSILDEISEIDLEDESEILNLKLAVYKLIDITDRNKEMYDIQGSFENFNTLLKLLDGNNDTASDDLSIRKIKIHDMINTIGFLSVDEMKRFRKLLIACTVMILASKKYGDDSLEDDFDILDAEEYLLSNIENKIRYLLDAPVKSKNKFIADLLNCPYASVTRLRKVREKPYCLENLMRYSNLLNNNVDNIKIFGYDFNNSKEGKIIGLDDEFNKIFTEYINSGMDLSLIGIGDIVVDVTSIDISYIDNDLKRKILKRIKKIM